MLVDAPLQTISLFLSNTFELKLSRRCFRVTVVHFLDSSSMKVQRVCGLGVIKHIMPLIIGSNQYYVLLTYICCCAMLLHGRVSARDKWFSSRPTLPIKTAFSSQHVWLFDCPGLDAASIAICTRFIRSQEHCSTYGDHFMNYGHRNTCFKINAIRAQTYSWWSAEFEGIQADVCPFFHVHMQEDSFKMYVTVNK